MITDFSLPSFAMALTVVRGYPADSSSLLDAKQSLLAAEITIDDDVPSV
jgi:hypothetical protein